MGRPCNLGLRAFSRSTAGLACLVAIWASADVAAQGAPQHGPAHKRLCKQRIEWTSFGGSRADAQRKAIDGWSAAVASQHGEDFTKWAIAGIARVSCTLTLEGHRCRAAASPCRDLSESGAAPPKR